MNTPLVLTVSQLNLYSKSIIDQDKNLSNVFVMGEISNFVDHYRSGHLYMSIKDSTASIKAVMFASNASRLKFRLQNGMSVIIRGHVSIYERDGAYQLYIDDIQPDGVGSLALAFEQLKEKLANEGLFDTENKKPLPKYPTRIGVISSPTGAAVQDVLNVLKRRFPLAQIVFAGVKVQGEGSADQICSAVGKMNALNAADVIIIARGGGSAEDLWEFNSEKLAYAIYNSRIPIISGVGHETDFTICDFVADTRAPTPSAAAELATPDMCEEMYYISSLKKQLFSTIISDIKQKQQDIEHIVESSPLKHPEVIIENCELYLDTLISKMNNSFNDILKTHTSQFSVMCSKLDSLNPLKVLARGYSLTKKDGTIISSKNNLSIGDEVLLCFTDGQVKAEITEV